MWTFIYNSNVCRFLLILLQAGKWKNEFCENCAPFMYLMLKLNHNTRTAKLKQTLTVGVVNRFIKPLL